MGNKNFIEINGKKYDALTGKMLDSSEVPNKTVVTKVTPAQNVGVMDGFVRKPQKNTSQRTSAHPTSKQTQKSKTLMRNSVKKPVVVSREIKAQKPQIHKSQLGTSAKRTTSAMQTPKSNQVHKYGEITHRTSVVKTANPGMAVKNETPMQPTTQQNISPNTKPSSVTASQAASRKMIDAALANAHSHEEPVHHHKRKKQNKLFKKLGISSKAVGLSSAVLAFVLLAGFFAVQNVPNLSMRVAAARSGLNASMPNYQPSGFSFKGPIQYSAGQVTVSFKSNTDNREYQVKQQASNWNSDALLANYVDVGQKQYQTYQDRGRTLYIYDGSNATWVDDGVWYQIEGESNMSTDQLIRIAASI